MKEFKNRDEYEKIVEDNSRLPRGFMAGVVPLEFYPGEMESKEALPMNLSLILLDNKTRDFAGVFTKNSFPGHPVVHGRKMLESEFTKGVLINNKISNVRCPGGLEDIDRLLISLSKEVHCDKDELFSSSTGIIGWKLPVDEMVNKVPELVNSIEGDSLFSVSKGIMTTDNFPKARSIEIGEGRIVAIVKGAGMIEPNMATMLLFILTDIKIEREVLRELFPPIIDRTFNRISIDSDQSTSDTGLIFSSGIVDGVDTSSFSEALEELCRDLCQDVVRNGEGTAHVIEVTVKGCKTEKDAVAIGKGVINAPLVKSAIFGNDANTGRIIQAVGDVTGNSGIDIDPDKVHITIGGETIYNKGQFSLSKELDNRLNCYLKDRSLSEEAIGYPEHMNNVEIMINLNIGDESATVYGSDLSYEYVRENADYRS